MSRRATESDTSETDASRRTRKAESASARASTLGTRRFHARTLGMSADFQQPFPRTLTVSALGMGSYLGDCTDADDSRYRASTRAAINSGVNVLDTASNYRCQRSERAMGQAIVEAIAAGEVRRDELMVCTKGGYVALDGEPPASREAYDRWLEQALFAPGVLTPNDLVRAGHSLAPRFIAHQLAQSRSNLGLEVIDLYYLHNPEEQLLAVDRETFRARMRAAFEVLEARASANEIAGYGCATWLGLRVPPDHRQHLTLADLMGIAREVGGTAHHFRAVQLPISLGMPEAARVPTQPLGKKMVTVLEAADALGLGIIASAPLMQGRLTSGLPAEMHELFAGCTTDAQRALRFAAALPGVATVLAGMRTMEHVRENVASWAEPA
jgi:aryl-alcohol dehydrogenase-like predicted oxidoreductase